MIGPTSNVGPAERMSAQAYTLKLPLVVLLCRASFNYLPIKRCWRGVAILKKNIATEQLAPTKSEKSDDNELCGDFEDLSHRSWECLNRKYPISDKTSQNKQPQWVPG